jgi:hypothetical protein
MNIGKAISVTYESSVYNRDYSSSLYHVGIPENSFHGQLDSMIIELNNVIKSKKNEHNKMNKSPEQANDNQTRIDAATVMINDLAKEASAATLQPESDLKELIIESEQLESESKLSPVIESETELEVYPLLQTQL